MSFAKRYLDPFRLNYVMTGYNPYNAELCTVYKMNFTTRSKTCRLQSTIIPWCANRLETCRIGQMVSESEKQNV